MISCDIKYRMLRTSTKILLIKNEYRHPYSRPASKSDYLPNTLGPLTPAGKLIGKNWAVL